MAVVRPCQVRSHGAGVGAFAWYVLSTVALLILSVPPRAAAQPAALVAPADEARTAICPLIELVARAEALPVGFFARLIWQESRFQPDVRGPLTRRGARAEGIAQFMPETAAARGLAAPFNPVEALPQSGALLAELRDEFGNLGLAAAAYNAGPQRVHDFIAGARDLPAETRAYVLAITGRPVAEWATLGKANASDQNDPVQPDPGPAVICDGVMALPGRVSLVRPLQVPGWCWHLHHPNVSFCGPGHAIEPALTRSPVARRWGHVHLVNATR